MRVNRNCSAPVAPEDSAGRMRRRRTWRGFAERTSNAPSDGYHLLLDRYEKLEGSEWPDVIMNRGGEMAARQPTDAFDAVRKPPQIL